MNQFLKKRESLNLILNPLIFTCSALVDSQDDSTKMMPPPIYSSQPNTPTSTIGCTVGLSQNLQLNGTNYNTSNYFLNGGDPSPNGSGSNETAQSDLWMKNEMLMEGQQLAQQIAPQSHYGTQEMMNGLNNANAYQQYNAYGSPMDYQQQYSYYARNQPEEYQPLATSGDNYNMNVKNCLCK